MPSPVPMAMASAPLNLLPVWVTWLWLAALAAVLIFHCGHFVGAGGQHRWFHASHVLMLVSMLYMFAMMEFTWKWFPSAWWIVIFCASTAALGVWMILRLVQRRPLSFLWALALVMQAAMIYMWMPAKDPAGGPWHWVPALTWAVVVYYGIEALAWLSGLVDDSRQTTGHRVVVPDAHGAVPARTSRAVGASNRAVGLLDEPKPAMAASAGTRARVVVLAQGSVLARVSMATMAASMAYMFAAMQLMRSAM